MQKKLLVAQWFEQLQLKLCSTPDVWADKRYHHGIYLPYTLAQSFIFPYTLPGQIMLQLLLIDPQLSGNIG